LHPDLADLGRRLNVPIWLTIGNHTDSNSTYQNSPSDRISK